MKKTNAIGNADGVLLDRKTYYKYINCGRVVAERIAEESGAIRRFGRILRYYRPAIDAYLASTKSLEG